MSLKSFRTLWSTWSCRWICNSNILLTISSWMQCRKYHPQRHSPKRFWFYWTEKVRSIVSRFLATRYSRSHSVINFPEDPLNIFDHSTPPINSVLKMFVDLFIAPETANLFYTNDNKVLIDILVRQLSDLSAGDPVSYFLSICDVSVDWNLILIQIVLTATTLVPRTMSTNRTEYKLCWTFAPEIRFNENFHKNILRRNGV